MDYTFISERLIQLMEQHDLSEYELSTRLGRCKSYINKIVSGKASPSMKAFWEICDHFQITPAEFFSTASLEEVALIQQIQAHLKELDPHSLRLVLLFLEALETPPEASAKASRPQDPRCVPRSF